MKVVHALQPLEKSIFLAGPTPRDRHGHPWRADALDILRDLGFDGTVFVPEPLPPTNWSENYDDQVHWEWEALDQSTVVAFWIPRDMIHMPALTTNIEFGLKAANGQAVVGFPPDTPKTKYLATLATRFGIPVRYTLVDTLSMAVEYTRRPYGLRI